MKSNKSEKVQVEWLISQIRELDRMIALHLEGNSVFTAEQYAVRRLEHFKELISILSTSPLNTTGAETFPLIHALTKENYSKKTLLQSTGRSKNAFDKTIEFYGRQTDKSSKNKPSLESDSTNQRKAKSGM